MRNVRTTGGDEGPDIVEIYPELKMFIRFDLRRLSVIDSQHFQKERGARER